MKNHNDFGIWGEKQVASFLKKRGLKILAMNFESKHSEIDIVALQSKKCARRQANLMKRESKFLGDNELDHAKKTIAKKLYEERENILCFIEVKTRAGKSDIARPSDAVDMKKQIKIATCAKQYILQNRKLLLKRKLLILKPGGDLNIINDLNCAMRFDIAEVLADKKSDDCYKLISIDILEGAF